MNIRIVVITLFFALFFGIYDANAQEYIVKNGNIEMPAEAEMGGMYEYKAWIDIYVFLTEKYAKDALEALKEGKKVTTAERNNRPYNPDEFGNFTIEVPRGGYVLFWCKDPTYKAGEPIRRYDRVAKVVMVSNTTAENETKALDEITVVGERTISSPEPANTALEGPDGMVRSFMYKIPYKVSEDMRIIVQPILYDRSDISDVESDTVYAYGRASYFDMGEYYLTQERRMNFDINNDSLVYYISLQGDTLFHSDIKRQSLELKKDTVYKDTLLRSAVIKRVALNETKKNDSVINVAITNEYLNRYGTTLKRYFVQKDSLVTDSIVNDSAVNRAVEKYDTITYFWKLKREPLLAKNPKDFRTVLSDAVIKNTIISNKVNKSDIGDDKIIRTTDVQYTTLAGNDIVTSIILRDVVAGGEIKKDTIKVEKRATDELLDVMPYVKVKNDTIYFSALDRFKGFDPDTSHPYPYGVSISVDGYNAEIYTVDFKDNGERRDPLRFLNFSFKEFLPDRKMFEEKMDDQRVTHPGELRLNFQPGKAVLAANDTVSYAALRTLEQQLRAAQNPANREDLYHVRVFGVASPEGNLERNKALAKERAAFAAGKIKSYVPRHVPINYDTRVAGWNILGDSLKSAGYDAVADAVYDIVNRFPLKNDNDAQGFAQQQREISRLPEYNTLIKTEFLPKLRTVTYNYIINKIGQLPTDTVIARYRQDPEKEFARGEYWCLFDNLQNDEELEEAAKIALRKTRNIDNADSIYCQGYWPYAAAVLACCYIRRDTVDLELLKPFFDLTLYKDSISGKERLMPKTMKFSHYDNKKIAGYINYPDMAANQLIMTLNSKDYSSRNIAILEGLIADAAREEPAYEQLLAFSMCLRGKYNGIEEKYVRARELVANSSPHNFVVMALAMDNPATTADDAEWLKKAAVKVDSLERNNVTKYLKSVVNIRLATDSLLNDADTLLADCFTDDLKFLLMGSNDADLLVRNGSKHNVFANATTIWSQRMDSLANDDKNAYAWFKRAITEATTKKPKERVVKTNLHKCFSLDKRYITILNIYMRDNKALKDKSEILAMLRRIRNNYTEKN